MHVIKLDLNRGAVHIDSAPIHIDTEGGLVESIAKLCSPPIQIAQRGARYRLLRKVSVCGQAADCVIEVVDKAALAVTFLFDLIEFFESSILESKIIKRFEKSLDVKLTSNHPSSAFMDPCRWGAIRFYYDARQGDLGLDITIACVSHSIEAVISS